jgi:hypothetical protein
VTSVNLELLVETFPHSAVKYLEEKLQRAGFVLEDTIDDILKDLDRQASLHP